MNLKDEIKILAENKGLTFKEVAEKAGFNAQSLHHKFQRNSLTVKDLQRLLNVLDKQMIFVDKKKP